MTVIDARCHQYLIETYSTRVLMQDGGCGRLASSKVNDALLALILLPDLPTCPSSGGRGPSRSRAAPVAFPPSCNMDADTSFLTEKAAGTTFPRAYLGNICGQTPMRRNRHCVLHCLGAIRLNSGISESRSTRWLVQMMTLISNLKYVGGGRHAER